MHDPQLEQQELAVATITTNYGRLLQKYARLRPGAIVSVCVAPMQRLKEVRAILKNLHARTGFPRRYEIISDATYPFLVNTTEPGFGRDALDPRLRAFGNETDGPNDFRVWFQFDNGAVSVRGRHDGDCRLN
jgi:hypothetical protein